MRASLIAILCLVTLITKAKCQDDYGSTPEGKKIIQMIASLPEIVHEKQYLKEHNVQLVISLESIPTKDDNNYTVSVSQDSGRGMLTGHQYFYINAQTHAISYFSVAGNKSIPLSVWRAHHYRD